MRAAAILGPGCSPQNLKPFQAEKDVGWSIGLPASRDDSDVVVVFGGDGTLHRHLAQLIRFGLPVLIVPSGSGNDFARALGFRRVRDSLAAWTKFQSGADNIHKIDVGVIAPPENRGGARGPRYFGGVAGVGLDAEVARRANKIPRWMRGNGGYALTLMPTILQFAPFQMKLLTREEVHSGPPTNAKLSPDGNAAGPAPEDGWTLRSHQPTLLAAFANAPWYGGGMKIAPQAKMDDGLLDICMVGAVDTFKLLCLFPTVYGGNHLKIPGVAYWQATRVRIETEHALDIYADGEFVCQTPAEIGVQREALCIVSA